MKFIETDLKGAFVIEPECMEDDRGFFARMWCRKAFGALGLDTDLVQCNLSFNRYRHTLRGMHYQRPPYEETKLVRCTRGAIFDVIIDLRQDSATYLQWTGVKLTRDNRQMLYVPKGCAHGYQTLADNTEVFYQVSQFYRPEAEQGIRWDDPAFSIAWQPHDTLIISGKDRSWPNYCAFA